MMAKAAPTPPSKSATRTLPIIRDFVLRPDSFWRCSHYKFVVRPCRQVRPPPVDVLVCLRGDSFKGTREGTGRFIGNEASAQGHGIVCMVREGPAQPAPPPKNPYPAEKARGGGIILKTPTKRWVFIAGLVGAMVLALILSLFR